MIKMILDLNSIGKPVDVTPNTSPNKDFTSLNGSSQQNVSNINKSNKIIKRVLHTRTELTIYPNGQCYIRKTNTWFEDKFYEVKKKEKKKAKPLKDVVKKDEESY